MALIEALVSLVILALGVLGLAAVQARMLVDTRTSNARAVAVRLIGELSERVQLNPAGANEFIGGRSAYSDATAADFQAGPATLGKDCVTEAPCTAREQAQYDTEVWRQRVTGELMGGKASIWQISPRQLQVVIAWRANENTRATLSDTAPPSSTQQVAAPMQITATAAGTGASAVCGASATTICHIDFIDIPPRK